MSFRPSRDMGHGSALRDQGLGSPLWTPAKLSGLTQWLTAKGGYTTRDAGAGDIRLTGWADQSPSAGNWSQATLGDQPAYAATGGPGGRPTVTNDGTNFLSGSAAFNAPLTAYAVVSCGAGINQVILSDASTTTMYAAAGVGEIRLFPYSVAPALDIRSAGFKIVRYRMANGAGNHGIRVGNGAESTGAGAAVAVTMTKLLAAGSSVQGLVGSLSELVLIGHVVTAAEDANMMAYLAREWGL